MTRTVEEKNQWDMQAYGCRAAAIDNALKDYRDPLMLAASMLSDAQEIISEEYGRPDTESARKLMNRAKYITGDGDSGKTVLLRLLTGVFQDFKGELSFDQIPINNYNLNTLRNHIGIYMQKQDIFSASLWENITLGTVDIKEQDVLDVFKIVGLDSFYKSLHKGFDTHLEPTGKQLSSSNVQKLLIARSLLNEPALLLLDEPMKLIAADDKQFLQNYLFSLKDVTIIFTTNDPSLISKSEMVIHLEKGSIKSIQNANASN